VRPEDLPFTSITVLDFEFCQPDGERPRPICVVAREVLRDRVDRIWLYDEPPPPRPPYPTDASSLLVAYFSSAEWACHLALGWQMPERALDPYIEFRNLTNGAKPLAGYGLLGAMAYFGLDSISVAEKTEMRDLAIRGGPYSPAERQLLLDYCQSDVDATTRLLRRMLPLIDVPRALLRARYMAAVARMQWAGVPVDTQALAELRRYWPLLKEELIRRVDAPFGFYVGQTFKLDRFARWLEARGIPWPRTPAGLLAVSDDDFRDMTRSLPELDPIRELRSSLSKLRLEGLRVGSDNRNRCLLSPFASRTGRNQPSNTQFIYGPSTWIRSLIRPAPGWGLFYPDYSQQEAAIAARLSGDPRMLEGYASGDVYLAFAKQAGAVPPTATKDTHGEVRDQYKSCSLGTIYDMQARSLSVRIGQSPAAAGELLRQHHQTYRRFWEWSDGVVAHALLHGKLWTVFGWTLHVGRDVKIPSLRNFLIQSTGAEMLRLACCLATERGVEICAPVHDAVLGHAPLEHLDEAIRITREAMAEASRIVLDGFEVRTNVEVVRYPARYQDKRGWGTWVQVWDVIRSLGGRVPQ
jgi:hypothetical protein